MAMFGKPLFNVYRGAKARQGFMAFVDDIERAEFIFAAPRVAEVFDPAERMIQLAFELIVAANLDELGRAWKEVFPHIQTERQVSNNLSALLYHGRNNMECDGLIRLTATRLTQQKINHDQDPQRTNGMVCNKKRITRPATIMLRAWGIPI